METIILVVHVVVALSMVVIILLQQGKGADAGASFGGGGGGASGSMFGSLGVMPFLTKLTAVLAVTFFVTSLTLAVLASKGSKEVFTIGAPDGVLETEDLPQVKVNPIIESDLPIVEGAAVDISLPDDVPSDAPGDAPEIEVLAPGRDAE
ncbi:MAG: preprotein translocase subunit SecG [Gammaproteobacteria bacterium]|nr:preprotein translocase subunit SecG [Gammaproteobacteria bacterium]